MARFKVSRQDYYLAVIRVLIILGLILNCLFVGSINVVNDLLIFTLNIRKIRNALLLLSQRCTLLLISGNNLILILRAKRRIRKSVKLSLSALTSELRINLSLILKNLVITHISLRK